MSDTVEVTLGRLVEDALAYLYHHMERPRPVFVGDIDLTTNSTVLSILPPEEISPTDRLERGHEIMLVTAKDESTSPPQFTVIRNYELTPNEGAAPSGTALLKNPRWKRYDVYRALLQGLRGAVWTNLPFTVEDQYPITGMARTIPLPEDTLGVARVGYDNDPYFGVRWVDDWQYIRDYGGSPVLQVSPVQAIVTSTLRVKRKVEYPISVDPVPETAVGEQAKVTLWRGTEDIVALWAAAYRMTGREMGRAEVNAMESWNVDAAQRRDVNIKAVQTIWNQVYSRLDEAKRTHPQDIHRPYRRRHRVAWRTGGSM
jgi:hypothetical protein